MHPPGEVKGLCSGPEPSAENAGSTGGGLASQCVLQGEALI